jgi:hypothetical protein
MHMSTYNFEAAAIPDAEETGREEIHHFPADEAREERQALLLQIAEKKKIGSRLVDKAVVVTPSEIWAAKNFGVENLSQ